MTTTFPSARPDVGGAVPGVGIGHGSPPRASGRVVAVLLGALLVFCGSLLSAAGSLGFRAETTRDADGFLVSGSKSFRTGGYALAFGADGVQVPLGRDWLGVVELRVDQDVFVGIGAADDVAEYLADVDRDEVLLVGSRHRDGGPAPGPPASRPIWVAYGTGSLAWQAEEGEWAVAVLNPDGSRVVDTGVSARATVPALRPLSEAVLTWGTLALSVGGVVLLAAASRWFRRPAVRP